MSPTPLFRLVTLCALFVALLAPLRAQRQMEDLGRGVVAVRPNATQVYIGWRLLGHEPADIGFNLYRSIGGAEATRLNGATPITASTNYVDTPGSAALAGDIAYHVAPVVNGVEQTPSAPYVLTPATVGFQQFINLPLATTHPNPDSTSPYNVKFCWVGDFDGDGEYDFLVDRVSTASVEERQYLEAYKRDGTFLWRMDMGVNSVQQYLYEPGSSAISVGDTDNVTVYDLDGDGRAEVAVRTANGVTVTNAAGVVVATVTDESNTSQFVSIIDGLSGAEVARAPLPNPWAQHGTLTNKCAIAYLDGVRPSVLFYGYNRSDSGSFFRVFTTYDYRDGQITQRWSTPQTFPGAEGHQIRVADVDNDGKDEILDIGHVIDDDGSQLFVIPEITHGDRFHVADIDPDRPGLENFIIQQNNPTFLATAYYDAGTGEMLKKWYATNVVDVGRGLVADMTDAHKGYEFFSTQPGIFNAKGETIYANSFFPYEGLWWDADLLREFIAAADGNGLNPVINKFNPSNGGNTRLWTIYSDFGSFVNRTAFGGRPAFWGDILGDWREELVFVTSDYASLRIYTPTTVAPNRLYTLMHNPAYRMQATTKGYVQASYVDYYLGDGMTPPPPPPMVRADLAWAGGAGSSIWNDEAPAWKNTETDVDETFSAGRSVRFDLTGDNSAPVALSGSLEPAEVTVYSPADYTFDGSAGSLVGDMKLVKAGGGSLLVTGSHPFTGATTVWDGALRVDGSLTGSPVTIWGGTWGGPLARGLAGGRLAGSGTIARPVTLGYRGAITPGPGSGAAGTLTLGAGLAAQDGSALVFDLSSDPSGSTLANDRLAITGDLALSGTVTLVVNPLSSQLAPGTYTLATYTGALTGSTSNLSVVVPEGTPYTVSLSSGALTLTIPVTRPANTAVWTGTLSGTWDVAATNNWMVAGAPTSFVAGDDAVFDNTGAARSTVTLGVSAPVGSVVFSGSTNYTVSGSGAIAGSGGLAKSGSGTVTLNTTNTFTGPVSITGGVLAVGSLADGGQPSAIGASASDAANLLLNGGTLRLVGSQTNTNRSVTLGSAGGVIDVPATSGTIQVSGSFTGSGSLTKTGSGSLILANSNSHTGGTVVQAGTLILASDNANASAIGSAGVTLQGGTLRMYNNTSTYNSANWPVIVPAGSSARFEPDGRVTFAGPLSGAGTLEFYTTFVRTDLTANSSAFAGTLNVTTDSDGGDLRFGNTSGLPAATVNLASAATAYSIVTSSHSFALGALSGTGTLGGNSTGSTRTTTWLVGAKGLDTTFAGRIVNSTGPAALTKVGAGTLTLTGGSTYTGATTVTAGKLVLAGGSLSGSAVTVQSGGAFGGRGSVTGNVTFNSGATLLANPAAGPLAITGNLTLGGALTVAAVPGATLAAGSYPLYTYTGVLTGTPNLSWSGLGYNATFDTSVPGTVSITLRKTIQPATNLVAVAGDSRASLTWTASPAASGYSVRRATAVGGPYAVVASDLVGTTYLDTGLVNGTTYFYIVTAVSASEGDADSEPASVSVGGSAPYASWRFDQSSGVTAPDSSGNGRDAALVNSPTWTTGRLDGGLQLASASSQHATLATGVVSSLNDVTFSVWVRLTSIANWARVFDFGTGTNNYVFLTPRSSTNSTARFSIRTPSVGEQVIDGNVALPVGSWVHVAVTLSGSTGKLYLNGVAIGTNNAITLKPSSLGATTQNYFGRSQFSADPHLNGAIDELLIFGRALTAAEIAILAAPPAAPGGLVATAGTDQVTLSWDTVPDATGYAVKRATDAAGPFATIATDLTGNSHVDTGLTPGTTYHYIVTALRSVAESANSTASATPLAPPAAPGGLVATAGIGQVTLSWDTVPEATGYAVKRATDVAGPFSTIATNLTGATYVDTGLTPGTTYHYIVTALRSGAESANSTASATPLAPLDAPGGLVATAGIGQVTLSWDTVPDATGYAVKRATDAAGPFVTIATNLTGDTYVDTGLTPGTTYHYIVTALRADAESANSTASATPLSALQSWRVLHFSSPDATGDAADDADPDGDGAVNFLEYALGGDPRLADASAILPTVTISTDELSITFQRIADPTLYYTVQASSDLAAAWNDIWTSTGEDNIAETVTVPDTESLSAHPRRFLRLKVTAP